MISPTEPKVIELLRQAQSEVEQAAREIYYAMSLIGNHPARANLKIALKCLGANHPADVGLSTSVLKVRE